jgi:hypothetical protein
MTRTRVIAGPAVTPIIGGDVARVVELANGGWRFEWWIKGAGWVEAPKGSITLYELMPGKCRPVLEKDAARLGCRLEDFGRHWTEEVASPRARAKLVHMLKERAWDLACRRMAPGIDHHHASTLYTWRNFAVALLRLTARSGKWHTDRHFWKSPRCGGALNTYQRISFSFDGPLLQWQRTMRHQHANG